MEPQLPLVFLKIRQQRGTAHMHTSKELQLEQRIRIPSTPSQSRANISRLLLVAVVGQSRMRISTWSMGL